MKRAGLILTVHEVITTMLKMWFNNNYVSYILVYKLHLKKKA